jgi:hypothetical protein
LHIDLRPLVGRRRVSVPRRRAIRRLLREFPSLSRIDATLKEFKTSSVEILVLLSRAPIASLRHEIDAYKSGLKAVECATNNNDLEWSAGHWLQTGAQRMKTIPFVLLSFAVTGKGWVL